MGNFISESGPCGLRGEVFSRELIPDGAGEYAEIFHNSPDTGDLMNLACISYSFQLLYIKIFEKFSDPDYLTYYRYKYFFLRNYRVETANEK